MFEIRLLGQFSLRRDGQPVALSSHPAQRLLAYLALYPDGQHTRDYLAGLLWPQADEAHAHNNLRQALWHIHHAGGDTFLRADRTCSWLEPGPNCQIDVARLVGGDDASTQSLIEAVSAYGGELLPGFYDDWITPEREHVHMLFEHRMQRLLDLLVAEGQWEDVSRWAERWIALGHVPEPAYRALMTAFARMGNLPAMSAAYHRCVEALHTELGVGPADETRDLYRQLSPVRHNLPAQLTSFVGREAELAQIIHLLEGPLPRLLTLTGPPGSGKTRLALQAAVALAKEFRDGVCFVPLASVGEPALVPHSIAAALGVKDAYSHQPLETLKYHLGGRQILLLLDNFEHLMPAAPLLNDLLTAADELKILVTSREILRLSGEQMFPVQPLGLPDLKHHQLLEAVGRSEACTLFIQRTQTVQPAFALTAANALTVASLCSRLDGLPLAIELAAARTRLMTPEALLALLQRSLDALVTDTRDVPMRHRMLRATIEWSYDLLDACERTLFNRLAVFVGGCTQEAAVAVCSPGLEADVGAGVEALVLKSLLSCQTGPGGEPRFTMLETLREYALERLAATGEMETVRRWHAECYLAFAERADGELRGPDQQRWWRRVDVEQSNLRAALDWSLSVGDPLLGLKLAGSLERYWWVAHCLVEGRRWLQSALAAAPDAPALVRARALRCAGSLAYLHYKIAEGRVWADEALALYREMGSPEGIARTLFTRGLLALPDMDVPCVQACQSEALELYRGLEDDDGIGLALLLGGIMHRVLGDYHRARECLEESLAIFRRLDAKYQLGSVMNELGYIWMGLGDYDRARASFEETMRIGIGEGFTVAVGHAMLSLGVESLIRDRPARAARLMGASEAILESIGSPAPSMYYHRYVAEVRSQLGRGEFESAWAEGRSMTHAQATRYALEDYRYEFPPRTHGQAAGSKIEEDP